MRGSRVYKENQRYESYYEFKHVMVFFPIEMNYKICYISFSIQINERIEVEAVFSSQLMCLGTEGKSLSLHRMA